MMIQRTHSHIKNGVLQSGWGAGNWAFIVSTFALNILMMMMMMMMMMVMMMMMMI